MFDTSPVSAPTANPGTGPSAQPANSTMSVVGLTFGIAANASRPTTASADSVATSETTRAGGREQLVPAEAAGEHHGQHDQRCGLPAHETSSRSSSSSPCSGVSAPPAPPSTRATSVAKYQPPDSTSATGPSAIRSP